MEHPIDYSLTDTTVSEFVKAAKPSAARTIFDVAVLCWGNLILSVALFLYAPSIWTYLLVFLMVSSRMNACLSLAHDAWHASLMPSRKWNDFLGGWICSYPFGSVFGTTRANHLAHHKYVGTETDPDLHNHRESDKETLAHFVGHFARHMFIGQLIITLSLHLARKKYAETVEPVAEAKAPKGVPEFANVVAMQAIIGSVLWAASGHWWMYFLVWFLPIATLGTLAYFLRAFCDHARLAADPPRPVDGRLITIATDQPLERAFIAPNDFNYHAEHHLYASVPHQYLPKLHRLIRDKEAYARQVIVRQSYIGFVVAYIREVCAPVAVPAAAEQSGPCK
jgi:fatty acid desaturase